MVLGYIEKSVSRFVLSGVFQLSKYLTQHRREFSVVKCKGYYIMIGELNTCYVRISQQIIILLYIFRGKW